MALDFHSKGSAVKRLIESDLREMVISLLSGLTATIAAQKDGVGVSDQHRVLNFLGGGVTVTDDPVHRRTNVFVPGGPATTATLTVVSNTTAKVVNVTPVTDNPDTDFPGWKTPSFNDAGWAAAVVSVHASFQESLIPPSSSTVWDTNSRPNTDAAQKLLVRKTFSIPSGVSISTATLAGFIDAWGDVWVNGVHYAQTGATDGSGSFGFSNVSVAPSDLIIGGVNVIAAQGNDLARGVAHDRSVAFRLDIVTNQLASGSTFSSYLGGDVTLTTLNTYFDGPSVTLPAGVWLLTGIVSCSDPGTFGQFTAKLWDGTTVLSSGAGYPRDAGYSASIPLQAIVSPTVSTTYKISVASNSSTSAKIKAAIPINPSGNTASYLLAMPA